MELKLESERCSGYGRQLLIVPYGIETEYRENTKEGQKPFNRTLWN